MFITPNLFTQNCRKSCGINHLSFLKKGVTAKLQQNVNGAQGVNALPRTIIRGTASVLLILFSGTQDFGTAETVAPVSSNPMISCPFTLSGNV
jgi:hypothetical protein